MREEIKAYDGYYHEILHTGSRVICDPPPKDTDDDYLFLTWDGALDALVEKLTKEGWILGGSMSMGSENYERGGLEIQDWSKGFDGIDYNKVFRSYKKADLNVIVTLDPHYFNLFKRATGLAKKLNLLKKEDRVNLFEAMIRDVQFPLEGKKIGYGYDIMYEKAVDRLRAVRPDRVVPADWRGIDVVDREIIINPIVEREIVVNQ